jgi:hypothetical protein
MINGADDESHHKGTSAAVAPGTILGKFHSPFLDSRRVTLSRIHEQRVAQPHTRRNVASDLSNCAAR